jgi:hypothetical protein
MAEGDTASETPTTRPRAVKAPAFHIVETKEPAYSVSPRNGKGDILTVRVPLVVYSNADGTLDEALTASATFDLFKALASQVVGNVWTDSTEVYFASFDPAVAQAMSEGATLEDALDLKDPSKRQIAAYDRLKGGGGRGASDSGGGGGRRSGGGGGKTPIDLGDMTDDAYNDLPEDFRKELRNGTQCPDCRSEKFWNNMDDPDRGKGPKIACANRDCEGGGKKRDGGFFPWGWFGSENKSSGGGGGGRRNRGS